MKYRKLRIAWSVAWGVICLLLIAMWARSYTRWDHPFGSLGPWHYFDANSIRGLLFVAIVKHSPGATIPWTSRSVPATSLTDTEARGVESSTASRISGNVPQSIYYFPFTWEINVLGIGVIPTPPRPYLATPYWFLILVATTFAAAP